MKILRQSLLAVLFSPIAALQAQPLADDFEATVRAEIEKRHQLEQEAFIEGDCEEVISFYSDEASIYANGRQVNSLEAFREFCSNIPRPFKGGSSEINDNFHILSENAAHFVRTIDIEPSDDESTAFKREVITKVWLNSDDGWKIVHFHSSVHSVSDK